MTIIEYKAINPANKIVFGSVTEDLLSQLEPMLTEQGLRLISYRFKSRKTYKTLTYRQQQTIWMSLRYYIMSQFTLVDAVKHMLHSSTDVKLCGVLHSIHHQLQQGKSFSKLIKQYLPTKDVLTISLLESAEKTGNYLETLYDLEEYAAWQLSFRGNIKQSLRYPSIVFGALWVAVFCILYFFAPQLSSYFQQTNYAVPTFTAALIKLSKFVVDWPIIWGGLPLMFIGIFKSLYHFFPSVGSLGVYIPGVRTLILGYYYTSISKVLYLQLKHGYSLIESFRNLQQAYTSNWIHPILIGIMSSIEKGISLSETLKKYNWFFTKFFIQLVGVGEQSNRLSENLKVLSAYYERETQQKAKNIVKLIEPLMLVLIGIFLIIIVGGLFYPMYHQIGGAAIGGL